jgi:nucleolar pre-ribosomal-associated protein 1
VRFDVGRLLVSSSSNKAERRERQQAKADKAGSVIGGETGSVASVGTAGTAGMGGGFGYARGDVKGFEALSQVHVVELLSQAKGWQWTNKAGQWLTPHTHTHTHTHTSHLTPHTSHLTPHTLLPAFHFLPLGMSGIRF